MDENNQHHKLVQIKNRGGLTAVSDQNVQIFFMLEKDVRVFIKDITMKNIDINLVINKLMKNTEVVNLYNIYIFNIVFK